MINNHILDYTQYYSDDTDMKSLVVAMGGIKQFESITFLFYNMQVGLGWAYFDTKLYKEFARNYFVIDINYGWYIPVTDYGFIGCSVGYDIFLSTKDNWMRFALRPGFTFTF